MTVEFQLLLYFVALLLVTWPLVLQLSQLLRRHSILMDIPDARKKHSEPTPMVGGLVVVPLLIMLSIFSSAYSTTDMMVLVFGMLILFCIGLLDDLYEMPVALRLCVQFLVAGLIVFVGGQLVKSLGVAWVDLGLGPMSEVFTIVSIVFLINAINMLDGMDGLAASVVIVSLGMLGLLSLFSGHSDFAFTLFLSIAPVLGFLAHNMRFRPQQRARAFLGDSGSLVLGLLLAWAAVYLYRPGDARPMPITIALVLAYPAGDSLGVFLKRTLRRVNPMRADRSHLHHLLLKSGFGTNQTLLLLVALHTLYGALAVFLSSAGASSEFQFVLMGCILLSHITAVVLGSVFVLQLRIFRRRIRYFLSVR